MNREKDNKEMEIDLLEVFRSLWDHAPAILIIGIICAIALFMFAQVFVTPKYEASTLFYVNNSNIYTNNNTSISTGELNAAASLVDVYIAILESRTTLDEVLATTGAEYSYEEFSKMVEAEAVNSTGLFRVTVRSKSPEEARTLANAIADVLPEKITDTVTNSSVEVIDYAVTPRTRVSPNYLKYTAIGLLAGMLLSGTLFVFRDMRDDIIRSEDYLLQTYAEVPIIGVIPDINAKTSRGYGYYGKGGK